MAFRGLENRGRGKMGKEWEVLILIMGSHGFPDWNCPK